MRSSSGSRPTGPDVPERQSRPRLAEHSRASRTGQTFESVSTTRRPRRRRTMARIPHGDRSLETLLDLLDEAVAAYGDKTALSLRLDDGSTTSWTYRELDRRSRLAAWRLRALGLEPGDRLLTWSPSTPELPATYFGAMRAGLILVPLDLRMSPDAIEGIVRTSGARHLVLGHRPRRPRSARSRPRPLPDHGRGRARRRPRRRPSRPTGRRSSAAWPAAGPERHLRARLHLGHDRHAEGRDARPRQRRRLDRDVPPDRARGWSTGSSRCCRCRTCSSRRSGCSTRCRSAPTSSTSGAGTRGSSSMRCATNG